MVALQGFPMVSQLTSISTDGSSPNAQFDCVPACLCAGVMYFKGVHAVNAEYNPDRFLDAAYGEGHKGGTDAKDYVTFLQSLGIRLYSVSAASASFQVEEVHTLLAQGLPAILTILDPYVPASYGWTHAVIAFADKPGEITVLDPYIGKPVTKSDSEWVALSRSDLLWTMEELIVELSIDMPEVAALFRQLDANHWQSLKTGCVLQFGFLADYKANGQASLERLGDVVQNEDYKTIPGKVIQRYKKGVRLDDNGVFSSLDIYGYDQEQVPGEDPLVGKLEAQLTAMQSQPAAPRATALLTEFVEAARQLGIIAK